MSVDPYLDPSTGVLHKLGTTDADLLQQIVADISAARLDELAVRPLPGSYDLDHLRAFHRAVFGDIFTWAGEIRTIQIFKKAGSAHRSTSSPTPQASLPNSPRTTTFAGSLSLSS